MSILIMRGCFEHARLTGIRRSGRQRLDGARRREVASNAAGADATRTEFGVDARRAAARSAKQVYGLARAVLRSVDDLLAVAAPGSAPAGELKIGVPPFLSELALEMPIDRLRAAFPRLTLRVTAAWSPALLERAMRAEVDAAVVMMPASAALPEAVTATLLAVQPTVIVASRALEWPDQAGKKRGAPRFPLVELARHPWVLNQDGCGMRSALGRAFAASSLRFEVAVEAFGSELQLSLVARGVGLGVVTPHQLAASAHKDALQVIEAPEFSGGLNVWLVHGTLPGRLMRPMDLLRDTLVEALAQTQRQ
jgi:DNA-binding transcriptional LysR family regulator